jgi:hypothetical protein
MKLNNKAVVNFIEQDDLTVESRLSVMNILNIEKDGIGDNLVGKLLINEDKLFNLLVKDITLDGNPVSDKVKFFKSLSMKDYSLVHSQIDVLTTALVFPKAEES